MGDDMVDDLEGPLSMGSLPYEVPFCILLPSACPRTWQGYRQPTFNGREIDDVLLLLDLDFFLGVSAPSTRWDSLFIELADRRRWKGFRVTNSMRSAR